MRQFLFRVTDRRITVALFLAFLILFCLGLVLPQRPLLAPGEAAAFAERWPALDRATRATGLDDVYRSDLMRVVFGACVLQLVAWLALRSGPVLHEALRPTAESPERMPIQVRCAGGRARLEALVDRTSIELFAGNGRLYMPVGTLLDPADRSLLLTTSGAPVRLRSLEVFELRSAWR